MIGRPGFAAAVFAIGVVALVLSEATILRVAAAVVLLIAIALGVFAIATPEFTAADSDERPDEGTPG